MQRVFILLISFLVSTNCSGTISLKGSVWQIDSISTSNYLFKEGMKVDFVGNKIRFQEGQQTFAYPVIVSDNRLVIETGPVKWLFEIERTSDTAVILHELYSKKPLEITLVKIKNKHKS